MSLGFILFHFIVGSIAIYSGVLASFMPKHGKWHKWLGRVYFTTMLLLGSSSSLIAFVRDIPLSFLNGLLLCYFVLTSFRVIRQAPGTLKKTDVLHIGFGIAILIGFISSTTQVLLSETGKLGGFGPAVYIFFSTITLIAVLEDGYFAHKRGAAGRYRIVRHLWRMYMPLFMSTAAFFLGQAKLFPQAIQSSGLLFVPVLFVILPWAYWMIKISISPTPTLFKSAD